MKIRKLLVAFLGVLTILLAGSSVVLAAPQETEDFMSQPTYNLPDDINTYYSLLTNDVNDVTVKNLAGTDITQEGFFINAPFHNPEGYGFYYPNGQEKQLFDQDPMNINPS